MEEDTGKGICAAFMISVGTILVVIAALLLKGCS